MALLTGNTFRPIKKPVPADGWTVDTLATGLTVPWEIVFSPDKSLLFTERNGKVRLYRHDQLVEKPLLRIADIDTSKKMGLLGLALHPGFAQNRYCYLAYNYRSGGAPLLKIVRYECMADTLLRPFPVLDGVRASPNHTGCRLLFGPDKKLYITTGDADRPVDAQDLKSLNGKILRVNDDGSIPADNPFVANDTARKQIWSYGHRNTQGLAFQPQTGILFNSEHGPSGGDEVNIIVKGGNYGWPFVHHNHRREGMQAPLLEYTPSIGPSQITFYDGAQFAGVKGSLLLACLRGERIIRFQLNDQAILSQEDWLTGQYGRLRALTTGPDGCLYFSTSQNDPPEGSPRSGYDMLLRLRPAGITSMGSEARAITSTSSLKKEAKKSAATLYAELCASCHGTGLKGTERAKSMLDGKWQWGGSRTAIFRSTQKGIIEKGMPAWEGALSRQQLWELADFIRNKERMARR